MKSGSSIFLPFFFLDPLSSSRSASSVIPSAAGHNPSHQSDNINEASMGLTIEVKIIHRHDIRLCLAANVPDTIRFSAITYLCLMAKPSDELKTPIKAKRGRGKKRTHIDRHCN